MLLEKLRARTSESHQQLEKTLVPRIKQATTTEAYSDILKLFYGYFHPLENLIDKHINNVLLPDYEKRRKAAAIVSDISYLTQQQGPFRLCSDLPHINNSRQVIGALYVMEGSTLGGKIIKSILMKNLGIEGNKGFDFFGGYGDDTDNMWRIFTHTLNDKFRDEETHHEVLTAANETFTKFKSWAETN